MTPLHVLLVGLADEAARLEDLATGLRRRGHTTAIVLGADNALGSETPDVLVVTRAVGAGLFGAFMLPTRSPHGVFVLDSADFEGACNAARNGAREILLTPTVDELVAAVERAQIRAQATPIDHFERTYTTDQVPVALRDLGAHCLRLGLGRGLRVRIVTAASELLANAAAYAFPGGAGPVTLFARLSSDPLGIDRLSLEVVDNGAGSRDAVSQGEGPGGLDFVRALAERLDVTTRHDNGFAARAEFALAPLYFDETPAGLDEVDHLDPLTLREVHQTLVRGVEPLQHTAPALAPTFGRLLTAGRDPLAELNLG